MAIFFKLYLFVISLACGLPFNIGHTCKLPNTLFYFAYGSNLLEKRLHRSCPSAVRAGIGQLKNYQLLFEGYSKRWHGGRATIKPKPGDHLWGAIWKISEKDLAALDHQEKTYLRLEVMVEEPNGIYKNVSTYQIVELKTESLPSKVYLDTIIKGACESKLPEEYQKFLENISCNGFTGGVDYDLY